MLRFWKDAGLTDKVSINAIFNNPLEETEIDGDNGETKEGDFYLAPAQAELVGDIDDEVTSIEISLPIFDNENYPVLIIGSEKLLITDGFGTVNPTVQRAFNSTEPAAHSDGDRVYAAYLIKNISLSAVDEEDSDESAWLTFRHYESGSYEAPHAVAEINYDESVHLQYQVIIPVWPAAYKRDIVPTISCRPYEIVNP
jgi:hypothetical protein